MGWVRWECIGKLLLDIDRLLNQQELLSLVLLIFLSCLVEFFLRECLSEQDALKSAGSSVKLNSMANGYVNHNYVLPSQVRVGE